MDDDDDASLTTLVAVVVFAAFWIVGVTRLLDGAMTTSLLSAVVFEPIMELAVETIEGVVVVVAAAAVGVDAAVLT